MNVKFYHRFLKRSDANSIPHHFLFGAVDLDPYNINVSFCEDSSLGNRILRGIKIACRIIFSKEPYDLLYASSPNGIELIVLLKCFGLFRKPIVVWQHRALKQPTNSFSKALLRFYYSGFNKMIMFSDLHVQESLSYGVIDKERVTQMQWGPDTTYYDKIIKKAKETKPEPKSNYFCSTGRENRDFPTLVSAFSALPESNLRIYTTRQHGRMQNEKILLQDEKATPNIQVTIVESSPTLNTFLSTEMYNGTCAVISCLQFNYTVGLTSLTEAMALGKAVIVSDNPYFPIDVAKEGVGIKVDYKDVQGWINAIKYLTDHPEIAAEMGRKGRQFIDEKCNTSIMARQLADCFFEFTGKKG